MSAKAAKMRDAMPAFVEQEDGGITAFALQMFLACCVLGGIAVDVGNAIEAQTQLQVAADVAAHTALYDRETMSADEAKAKAVEMAALNMPSSFYGTVLKTEDISFGHWDRATETFEIDGASKDAVMVSTQRVTSNSNGVGTFLLGIVGLNDWDIQTPAVFETYYPGCLREGFVAEDRVDMQSNTIYLNGFCIHSNSWVEVSSNNVFQEGAIVSMPDKRDIVLPNSGFDSNEGLEPALRDASYQLRIVNRINDIIAGVQTLDSVYSRSYITDVTPITVDPKSGIGATTITPHRIHTMTCKSPNAHVQIGADAVIQDAVLITNCRLQIQQNAVIEDAVIITTNTGDKSIFASSAIKIGKDDDCASGGDVQILTKGGIDFASNVEIYGSQIIAVGNIAMTANAEGIEGASIISAGSIDVTSNGAFGFCGGDGMENNFEAAYFRLAQ